MTPVITVRRRQVELFEICEQNYTREEAIALYRALAQQLGVPAFEVEGCHDRMSHGAHWHGGSQRLYCSGRSQDAT